MKNKLLFTTFIVLISIALPTRADEAFRAKLLDFERRALYTRGIETVLQDTYRSPYLKEENMRKAAILKLFRQYAEKPIPEDAIARDFFVYYGAYLQMLAGETAAARATFAGLIGSPTMTAEALVNYQKLDSAPGYEHLLKSGERNRFFKAMLGKLLPVGDYGQAYDRAKSKQMSWGRPLGRPIGLLRDFAITDYSGGIYQRGRPGMVADAFAQMKLHRWSAIASLELLYGNPLSASNQEPQWIFTVPHLHWDAVAQAQWQLGNEQQLASALARLIVFSYNSRKDEALQLLARWREEGLPTQPEAAQPDALLLRGIIEHYAEMNMHPRSLELLREFNDVIGPRAAELREKYEKEWLGKVRARSSSAPGALVFGKEIDTPEKRLNIIIPPPLRPEMIEEAKQVIQEWEDGTHTNPVN